MNEFWKVDVDEPEQSQHQEQDENLYLNLSVGGDLVNDADGDHKEHQRQQYAGQKRHTEQHRPEP